MLNYLIKYIMNNNEVIRIMFYMTVNGCGGRVSGKYPYAFLPICNNIITRNLKIFNF